MPTAPRLPRAPSLFWLDLADHQAWQQITNSPVAPYVLLPLAKLLRYLLSISHEETDNHIEVIEHSHMRGGTLKSNPFLNFPKKYNAGIFGEFSGFL